MIQRKYTYDTNSNRTQIQNASNVVLATGTYNDQDQITNYQIKNTGGTTLNNYNYTYDDFGNRLTKIDTINNIKEEYVYNTLGALVSYVRKNNTTNAIIKNITYQNDALGRRITRSDNGVLQVRYIYDENIRLVGEVSPSGDILTHYIYANKSHTPAYMRRGTINYKFATNAQGSIRYVYVANTGVISQELNYDEFGNVLTDTNPGFQAFGFAGGLYDKDSKLTRFGARDYDAQVGRWTAKDPIRFNGGDVNLYEYSFSDPVNFFDSNGLWALQIGFGGSLFRPTIGGAGEFGLAISYSSENGLQLSSYYSTQGRGGIGADVSAGLNISFTPGAKQTCDLDGVSVGGGFTAPIGSLGYQSSTLNGTTLPSYGIGVGPGLSLSGYGSISNTSVGKPFFRIGGR